MSTGYRISVSVVSRMLLYECVYYYYYYYNQHKSQTEFASANNMQHNINTFTLQKNCI